MEATDYLKSFFTEHWKYMAVSAACKLNIFDELESIMSAQALATKVGLNEQKTMLLLEVLFDLGFLIKNSDGYKLSELSSLLTEKHPHSLKYACLNWSSEHMDAWQFLDYSIKTGKSSFEYVYKQPFFNYLNSNSDRLKSYHKAMFEYARVDYRQLPTIVDFGLHKTIMDVGGGLGAAIEAIKCYNPELDCKLFDLEKVLAESSVCGVEKIAGDFFITIPGIHNAIILARVLHDWNDSKASIILQNCHKALQKDGTLYVIENCINSTSDSLALLSLNMSAMCESMERTDNEYIQLCELHGFHYETQKTLNKLQTILIFKKR